MNHLIWIPVVLACVSIFGGEKDEFCFKGIPEAQVPEKASCQHLVNSAYEVGYSTKYCIPLWAAYKVDVGLSTKRPKNKEFKKDVRVPEDSQVEHEDYSQEDYHDNPHAYDRAHMAPSYAIGKFGKEAQNETFITSNICPQQKYHNQQTWNALESVIADRLTSERGELNVFVGPVLNNDPELLNSKIAIPKSFFMILCYEDENGDHVLALEVEQKDSGTNHNIRKFLKSVRDIENKTGLNYFPDFPTQQQDAIEKKKSKEAWSKTSLSKQNLN